MIIGKTRRTRVLWITAIGIIAMLCFSMAAFAEEASGASSNSSSQSETTSQTVSYTVEYTDGHGNDLADKKVVEDALAGTQIVEKAPVINGYKAHEEQQNLTLEPGESKRVVFYYEREYILYDSDTRSYSELELDKLSDFELFIARNELYARHGHMFSSEFLQRYFGNTDWYEPRNRNDVDFSEVEQANLDAIATLEEDRQSIFLEEEYLNQLNYNVVGPNSNVPTPLETADATNGNEITLCGTLKRRDYPTTETDMAWVAAIYWLLLDKPISITFTPGGENTPAETDVFYAIPVHQVELSFDERDNLGKIWEDSWDSHLNKRVSVSGTVISTGNAHTFGTASMVVTIVKDEESEYAESSPQVSDSVRVEVSGKLADANLRWEPSSMGFNLVNEQGNLLATVDWKARENEAHFERWALMAESTRFASLVVYYLDSEWHTVHWGATSIKTTLATDLTGISVEDIVANISYLQDGEYVPARIE